ncbi:NO-inducible flavohemoprotein [Shouchella lonarensis]|uniref:Flavohemoprotein n=1 Tax=Shouchella lonarensis TaxID=1464122 RepID=A0A1G6GKA1_9BACI|nr:NO-inducible flavohemoprotein [Shouchella lonarensis]SDB82428.1 nitric oxide dioxygenase [Shouchella lonarensis]
MVSAKTVEIVKATAPVLAEKGEEITACFYQNMFADHPELLNIFNHANQKQGRQQAALARTVYAAALHIDQLEELLPVVKQIAHKHRSLGVKRADYPIVGAHLLRAMKEVLGVAATPNVLSAWEEAYGVIAQVFIDVEADMYEQAATEKGGWHDFKDFTVVRKEEESTNITSFYLKPRDGGELPRYLPGQYVTVRVRIPDETYMHNRQYSLSAAPGKGYMRISVKREDECEPKGAVSLFLHEQVKAGDVLSISAPAGSFTLNASHDQPIVFISGGVGVTPLLSMLQTVAVENPTRPVTFIQVAQDMTVCAFRSEIEACLHELPEGRGHLCLGEPRIIARQIKEILSQMSIEDSDAYVCGPIGFMKMVIDLLQRSGMDGENIHYECFGPDMPLK